MSTSNNDGDAASSKDADSFNDTSPSRRRQSVEAAENETAATSSPEPARRPSSQPQAFDQDANNERTLASSAATINNTPAHPIPRIRPCSLLPSTWSKRRIRISTIGCLISIVVCTARLLLLPAAPPSAYVIHSIIILFDMILIHVFTYTLWLSLAGECTAVVFAFCFHFTGETIFELLETTLIAVLVSFHMIRSRNEHWNREDDLERDMIGLHFYIEHNHDIMDGDGGDGEEDRLGGSTLRRRISGLSKSDRCENDVETGRVFARQHSMVTNLSSSFATDNKTQGKGGVNKNGEGSTATRWWDHFFEHFLDGSAGVMYTSFLGLIIDELVNYTSSPSSAKFV